MHLSGYILAVTAKNTPALRERRDIAIRHFDDVNQMFPLDRVAELLASVSCSRLVGYAGLHTGCNNKNQDHLEKNFLKV